MRRRHAMPFGAEIVPQGVRFALWSPSARAVALMLDGEEWTMPPAADGWRRLVVPAARAGSRYAYRIDGGLMVPDPASRAQPDDVHGESAVVDPGAYEWSDEAWTGRPWEEAVICEVHVGTATAEGTYAALGERLGDLVETGITAIELMPLAEFPGQRNWGYDGVLPFAPDAAYGSPDDLKRLVDRAHGLGLTMLLDVVYNHFGPSGNYLDAYAGSFFTERHRTPWGAGLNFDGSRGAAVRSFFIHNAAYWLEEFHFDGLRLDAVHAILDDSAGHILAEIAEEVRRSMPGREIHLVLENDANEARWLPRQDGRATLHTAQWNDDIHHAWHTLLTGETDGYYADYADAPTAHLQRALAEGFAYQGEVSRHRGGAPRGEASRHLPPAAFVSFLQNHDQVGNRALGERLSQLVPEERLALARAGLLLAPQIPLLFMGEEWSASAPFLFFVDFADDPALSAAVRDGRRREFEGFMSFAGGGDIPDPTSEETFARSRIDWSERARPPHRDVLANTRELITLRRERVVPITKSRFLGTAVEPHRRAVDVTWRYEAGNLRFVANVAASAHEFSAGGGEVVWTSHGAIRESDRIELPPWTGAFLTDTPR